MSSSRNYLSAFEEFLQQNNCPAPPPTCGSSSDADQDGGHVQAVEAVEPGSATSTNSNYYYNYKYIKISLNNN